MKIVAVTQARTGSSRLPGKVLLSVGNCNLLELHLKRIRKSKKISELILATTNKAEDQRIVEIGQRLEISSYCGSENDVLDRFYQAVKSMHPDYIVRLTSDCPLIDAELIDKVITYTINNNLDYCSNTLESHYPDGEDIEVFKFQALETAWISAKLTSEREHVTPYIWKNSSYKGGILFKSDNFSEGYSFGHLRITVDEPKDLELIRRLIQENGDDCSWLQYANYITEHSDARQINEFIQRNEGYYNSIKKEENE